jgi:hypothetical protein
VQRSAARLAGALALVVLAAGAGCTTVGPEVIRSGRPAYNDAILQTNDEQLLQNIVRLRFADSVGFLNVSSVTANVTLTTTGGVNVGWGPTSNYAGNLVPFTGTVSTEQNPTISYAPVSGDRLVKQLVSEIPLDLAVLIISSARPPRSGWNAIVRRINGLRNPDFAEPPDVVADPRFEEAAALLSTLQRRGVLLWVQLEGGEKGYAIVLHGYAPQSEAEVTRLAALLDLAKPAKPGADWIVPVHVAVGTPERGSIGIETRSLLDVMRIAAAAVDVPADLASTAGAPRPGIAGSEIRILSASSRPEGARVAIPYRGRWYWIDDRDAAAKQWFSMLLLLANASLPPSAGVTPLLTIPVTRK